MKPKIVTIGVYGYDCERFFRALVDARIDTFCDLRLRRGMRGSLYAFVNSASLQQRLQELGIRYVHCKELAPSPQMREKQAYEDEQRGIAKRTRTVLGEAFVHAYEQERLASFDAEQFLAHLGQETRVVGLFCVEREPEACHRSLLARKLTEDAGVQVEHVMP